MKKEVIINDKVYYVAKPTSIDENKARLQQSRTFNEALVNGAVLKVQLQKVLKDRGIWDEKDDEYLKDISEKLESNLSKLEEGGIDIMEARKLAIETNKLRMEVVSKLSILRENNSLTAEGQADDAYFDCLVANCCYKEDGTKVFKDYQHYISQSSEEYAKKLAQELFELVHGGTDYLKELPENKFLLEFGFVNDDLEYVDEDGNKVDRDYNPVKPKEEKPKRKPFLKNGKKIGS